MKRRVFVTAFNVKAPGISGSADVSAMINGTSAPLFEHCSVGDNSIQVAEFSFDSASPFYPSRSNEKVMRKEVIAAFLCIREMMASVAIDQETAINIPLFMAGGVCMEKTQDDIDWFSRAFKASTSEADIAQKNKKLAAVVPPLLALRTLTNSAESFVAEGSRLSGDNTTFGNTSISTYYAINEAFRMIADGTHEVCVAGGASRGGIVSYIMFKNFFENTEGWKEGSCSGFVLMESEQNMRKNNRKPLFEITALDHVRTVPSLEKRRLAPFTAFTEVVRAPLCIYSGAFSSSGFQQDTKCVSNLWSESFSWFPLTGNTGTGAILLNLAAANHFLRENVATTVDCIDRNPYGRESIVRIQKV